MNIGEIVSVSGCFTKEKFIAGRTLGEIENILGFRAGRLSGGVAVAVLLELPGLQQFELAGYSQVATHRRGPVEGLNIEKLKAAARETWTTAGFERLVKVLPAIRHDPAMNPDIQYPPGRGVPQWIATVSVRATVVAVVAEYPLGRYIAAGVARK